MDITERREVLSFILADGNRLGHDVTGATIRQIAEAFGCNLHEAYHGVRSLERFGLVQSDESDADRRTRNRFDWPEVEPFADLNFHVPAPPEFPNGRALEYFDRYFGRPEFSVPPMPLLDDDDAPVPPTPTVTTVTECVNPDEPVTREETEPMPRTAATADRYSLVRKFRNNRSEEIRTYALCNKAKAKARAEKVQADEPEHRILVLLGDDQVWPPVDAPEPTPRRARRSEPEPEPAPAPRRKARRVVEEPETEAPSAEDESQDAEPELPDGHAFVSAVLYHGTPIRVTNAPVENQGRMFFVEVGGAMQAATFTSKTGALNHGKRIARG